MKLYYSNISQSIVTEAEAHLQIISKLERYYHWSRPKGNFEHYFIKHPELVAIKLWGFREIQSPDVNDDSVYQEETS